ncbi:MAG: hypothetical protein R3B48_08295 [Kofleriaceae bacterium]
MRRGAHPRAARAAALIALALAVPRGPAVAEALRATDDRGRIVDWSAGLLLASGLGVADRHAPSPEVARPAARERAIAEATRALIAAARLLPVAGGRPLGELVDEPALARAAASASILSADPLVDGSWRVQLGLPLERLRQAAQGARAAPDEGDRGIPLLVVRAPATVTPQLGLAIGDQATRWRGATLWAKGDPAGVPLSAAALGKAPSVKVEEVDADGLRISKVRGVSDATLFVVVLGK